MFRNIPLYFLIRQYASFYVYSNWNFRRKTYRIGRTGEVCDRDESFDGASRFELPRTLCRKFHIPSLGLWDGSSYVPEIMRNNLRVNFLKEDKLNRILIWLN